MSDSLDRPEDFYAMKYSQAAIEAFESEVERQGGAMLPEKCLPELIEYKSPQHEAVEDDPSTTAGCHNAHRAVMTYDPGDDIPEGVSGSGFLPACAICDGMGAWPRFEAAVRPVYPKFWRMLGLEPEEEDND